MTLVPRRGDLLRLVVSLGAVALTTAVLRWWLHLTHPIVAALLFLLIVLITAATSPLAIAVATAIVCDLWLNYFFMPPLGAFTIADPQYLVALFVFLAVGVIGSKLSLAARTRAQEALARRDEMTRLFDLSRDVLVRSHPCACAVGWLASPRMARYGRACEPLCRTAPAEVVERERAAGQP